MKLEDILLNRLKFRKDNNDIDIDSDDLKEQIKLKRLESELITFGYKRQKMVSNMDGDHR